MIEFWKSVVEHILSWPVAAFVLGMVFRRPLTELVGRIINIKGAGFELAAPPASAQIESKSSPSPEAIKGEIGSTTPEMLVPLATVPDEKREAVRAFGVGFSPIVDEDVTKIKGQLDLLNFPLDAVDTAEILVRHLAVTQLMVRCERTHRLIFGSQIVALHMMNNTPQPESAVRAIFEQARTAEPKFYGSYTFDDWIGFLSREITVIKTEDGQYAITVYGRSYLQYISVFATAPRPH
jgi:hypothetical protein